MLNYSLEVMELHINKDTHVNILGSVIIMLLFIVTCTFVMAFMFAYRAFYGFGRRCNPLSSKCSILFFFCSNCLSASKFL